MTGSSKKERSEVCPEPRYPIGLAWLGCINLVNSAQGGEVANIASNCFWLPHLEYPGTHLEPG